MGTDKIGREEIHEYAFKALLGVCLAVAGVSIVGGILLVLGGAIPAVLDTIPDLIEFITLAMSGEKTPDELMETGMISMMAGFVAISITAFIMLLYMMSYDAIFG